MTSTAVASSVRESGRAAKRRGRTRSIRRSRTQPRRRTSVPRDDVPPVRLIFVRHGETELNRTGKLRGLADVKLNERGHAQALAVAGRLSEIELAAIYASPLSRMMHTAEAIAAGRPLIVTREDRLRDIDYGAWEARTPDDIERNGPKSFRRWRADPGAVTIPGGERLSAVRRRVHAVVRDLAKRHPGDTVVVVGHDVIGRVLLALVLGMPLRGIWRIAQDNGALDVVDVRAGYVVVRAVNDTAHLHGASGDEPDGPVPRSAP